MVVGKRIIVILASLALLYSFGINEALSQANVSRPPGVPEFIGGEATIEGQPAQGGEVYLKMVWLCIIFLDGLDEQGDIESIVNGLNDTPADTGPLALEFLNSDFCQNYGPPPLELLGPTTVTKISVPEGEKWEVTDPGGTFHVIRQDIKIWQGGVWVSGYSSLRVKMHNCKIAYSSVSGGSASYSLVLEVNDLPENIWWGDNTYTLLDPGSANVDDVGYFFIKKDGIERRVTTVNDQPIDPHYRVGQQPFSLLDLDAPESIRIPIPLCQGFNLFSVPFYPLDPDLDVALADIITSMDSILALRDGQWKVSAPAMGGGWSIDQVKNLNGAEAYVIYMKSPHVLELEGIPLEPVDVPVDLQQGFNLAPYNSISGKTVEEAFAGIRDDVDTFLKYNCIEGKWEACVPAPGGTWALKQFNSVEPGDGLTIYLKVASTTWNVEP
jgi:hypothetical protein